QPGATRMRLPRQAPSRILTRNRGRGEPHRSLSSGSRPSMSELPPALTGAAAWYGPAVAARADWIEALSPAEGAEIELAARPLGQAEIAWQALRPEDFPLPTLGRRLPAIIDEVLGGRGFVLLRGLPVERWGRRLSAVAFLGLGLHWGSLRPQNGQGHL